MGRKKRPEDREKVDRWLVSYADFITLLFATFVILYALSQVDVSDFTKLNESIKTAFDKPSIMQGSSGIMPNNGDSILEGKNNSVITPLMLEYTNPKYEQEAYNAIKQEIEELSKLKELKGVKADIDDRGLVVKLENADIMFQSGTAKLEPSAMKQLDKVGLLISQKFMMHSIRIEGNTDDLPVTNRLYPSNWELSSARACSIVRYLADKFKLKEDLFTAVGYGSTRPIVKNNNEKNRAKNRRVEIIVVRNKYKVNESAQNTIIKMNKKEQEAYRLEHINAINGMKGLPPAKATAEDISSKEMLLLNKLYESETKRINQAKTSSVKTNQEVKEVSKETSKKAE